MAGTPDGPPHRAPPHPGAAGSAFEQADRLRRLQGQMLDALGLGPIETPFRVVSAKPGVELRAYGDGPSGGPVWLIVPAPIKRAYIWDLVPWASVVRRCLEHGGRVYMAVWTEPGAEEQGFGLAEYADRFILDGLEAIEAETGERRVLLAGHSLGGTLAAIFAALHPERVRGLVLLEAPLQFAERSGAFAPLLGVAPDAEALRRAAFGNRVPGTFIDLVSVAASPATFLAERWLDWFASLEDAQALLTHIRVERWTLDEFPLPGRLFEEVVDHLYREDRFMRGTLTVGGRPALPKQVSAPLMNVIDPYSRIIPRASVVPFHRAVSSRDKRLLRYTGDRGVALQHVGVLVGRNAHRTLWPEILRWAGEVWRGG